jgi:hypothetical protein
MEGRGEGGIGFFDQTKAPSLQGHIKTYSNFYLDVPKFFYEFLSLQKKFCTLESNPI